MTADTLIFVFQMWAYAGAAVALVFLTIGMDRVDEDARGAYAFRVLLVPGVLLIWPFVLWRWWVLETGRDVWAKRHKPPRAAHFWVGWALPLGIVAILAAGLLQRQVWPADFTPQQLAAPGEVSQ